MSIFGSAPRKRKSPRAILNALNRRLEKKKKKEAKKKEVVRVKNAIESARKKLRGY